MWDIFCKVFLNPVGLIVLGFITFCLHGNLGDASFIIGGILIAIGIVWLVIRSRNVRKAIAANLPLYLEIVDALKNSGYEVSEPTRKKDHVRTNVSLNGKYLGEVFLVAPPKRYAQFRKIEDMTEEEFKYAYTKKTGESPKMSSSFWPNGSLIGAWIEKSADNYAEKAEWLSKVAAIYKEKN